LKHDEAENKWAKRYPQIQMVEVTVQDCASPEIFEREIDLVFRRTWLYAGVSSDLAKPGEFVVREYPALKSSVLLMRGTDGEIRAFHNVCRHRGAKLVVDRTRGNARAIWCHFHGWTYDTAGHLVAAPGADADLKCERLGLVQIASETWNGLVFINFAPVPAQSFQDFLGPLATHVVNKFPFDREWESWSWNIELRANWKIVKDLFQESYHVSTVHKDSVNKLYHMSDNPFHKSSAVRFFGPHALVVAPSNSNKSLHLGPVAALTVELGGESFSRFGKAKSAFEGVNSEGVEQWAMDGYGLFPNFNLHIFGGLWHYFVFEPLAVDRCLWENRIFFPKAKNFGERFAHEFSVAVQQTVTLEDLSAAERNQAGVESQAFTTLPLTDEEIILRHTRKSLAEFMRDGVANFDDESQTLNGETA